MKVFHRTSYNVKCDKELRIVLLSDIHFSYRVKDVFLNSLVKRIREEQPNYIMIAGDIIDSLNMIYKEEEKKRLFRFLEELGKICVVLISIGNHDYIKKTNGSNNASKWVFEDSSFWSDVDKLQNVFVLDNKEYEDDKIYVAGITQDYKYYYVNDDDNAKCGEQVKEMVRILDSNKKILPNENCDKLKIALIHSPILLKNDAVSKRLKCFDYVFSGHMHNGCVPPLLYELWNSDKGIIAPSKKLWVSNVRNTLSESNNILVNGPVTTFHECTGLFYLANILFPSYYSVISFGDYKFSKESKYIM